MADKISLRFQTPEDSNGNRKDIHMITSTDEVIDVSSDPNETKTLSETLRQTGTIQIQAEQPDFACIWAKPVE